MKNEAPSTLRSGYLLPSFVGSGIPPKRNFSLTSASLRSGYFAKGDKKRIVLAGGVFDILHFGHIHFLKEAKKLGDHLVVIIESDKRVKKLKGDSRPFHNQAQRKEILESLKFVDEVIVLKDEMTDSDYAEIIARVEPLYIAVTAGDPMINKKKIHAKRIGAKIIEIKKVDVPSTTQIAKLLEIE